MRWIRPTRAAAKNDLGTPEAALRGYATFACEGMRSDWGCDVGSWHVAAVCDAASIQSLVEVKRTGRDPRAASRPRAAYRRSPMTHFGHRRPILRRRTTLHFG